MFSKALKLRCQRLSKKRASSAAYWLFPELPQDLKRGKEELKRQENVQEKEIHAKEIIYTQAFQVKRETLAIAKCHVSLCQ